MRRLTQDEFVARATEAHNTKYTYSHTVYVHFSIKVAITCPEHGDFMQLPGSHLQGHGCPRCSRNARRNTNEFITQGGIQHGGKYKYPRAVYVNESTKTTITCPEHGDFQQRPGSHLSGAGCPKCGDASAAAAHSSSTEDFVAKATTKHGGKYTYPRAVYGGKGSKLIITCPKHGEFKQTPNRHLAGQGCPKCGLISAATSRSSSTAKFVASATDMHGEKYAYPARYVSARSRLTIACPKHGEFKQTPNSHLSGVGCPKCGRDARAAALSSSTVVFVATATAKHEGRYSYSRAVYDNAYTKVTITCPEHGDFQQCPHNHLNGAGCPRCSESKGEGRIRYSLQNVLAGTGLETIQEHRITECRSKRPLPFDFALTAQGGLRGLIEYQGEQHYEPTSFGTSMEGAAERLAGVQKHDAIKRDFCTTRGISLLVIPYWDFDNIETRVTEFVSRVVSGLPYAESI